jgi:hypothetical protein
MHDYILGWTPVIVFLIGSYFYRRGLSELRLMIKDASHESSREFKSATEKLDAIHAEMLINLRLHSLRGGR